MVQEDLNSCPVCFDELGAAARTITACGHHFCSTCIREVLAHGNKLCPICRRPVKEGDLLDACSEAEAAADAAGDAGDFGAKVAALLGELATLRGAEPGAKAVVFSSWGRLLRLVGEALAANGLPHASLCGASLAQRQVGGRRGWGPDGGGV